MTEQQNQKQRAIDLLESRYRGMENVCEGIGIAAAVKGASLSWTTEPETDQNTVSDDDNTQTGGNGGGGNTPSGELEG